MGRMHLRPLKVHDAMTLLRRTKTSTRTPPWYEAMAQYPPASALVRKSPVYHRERPIPKKGKKPSKAFMPMAMVYPEDNLRKEFFTDHPWELARPRTILEQDGRDGQRWDWSLPYQVGRPVNGESVVQRQLHLMSIGVPHEDPETGRHTLVPLSKQAAYDVARKELYERRHEDEMEMHIAREEATMVDADFGMSANDIGMQLEGKEFDRWKAWAEQQATLIEQSRSAAYGGTPGAGEREGKSSQPESFIDAMPDSQNSEAERQDK